jgi:hypothetical protein
MARTGRQSFTTFDVTPYGVPNLRLRPPASLGTPEKRVFQDLINRVPVGQFRESDLPLICRWCELTIMAEKAAAELATGGMVTADGKLSVWFTIHQQATKSLSGLALRLRLGPQSRAGKAPKTLPGVKSYYDSMPLLEGKTNGDVKQE